MRKEDEENAAALVLELHRITMRSIHSMRMEETASLRLGQMAVMNVIEKHGCCRMSDIGKALGVSKSNVTTMVDRIVKDGFAQRQDDKDDRRATRIILSKEGKNCLRGKRLAFINKYKESFSRLDDEEVAVLRKSLETAFSLLQKGYHQ